jgi:branched-chain amino acid transport system ATP-binding protein
MLSVEKINTFYEDAQVLFDVSLEIREGEVVALLGRNGAGKTTTIRSIMGLTPPRAGRVMFKNENLAGLPPYTIANRGVGFVPDNRRIFPTLSVKQNLEIARKGGSRGTDGWTLDRIYQHFPKLKEIQERKGEVLSGGEQQMLTIARELKDKGETILVVEQNSTLALSVSQRAYILENGHVVHGGSAEAIAQNAEIKQRYLGI